jgi:hypothetical protein
VYEQGVLAALRGGSEDAQEAAFTQLLTFYSDTKCACCAARI